LCVFVRRQQPFDILAHWSAPLTHPQQSSGLGRLKSPGIGIHDCHYPG
jgi:hypothetical protein